jgi:hypothetical protein
MSAEKLAPFHPTPEVLALGEPERVFAESPAVANLCRWAAQLLGGGLVLAAPGAIGWFWLLAPAELNGTPAAQLGFSLIAAVGATMGALLLASAFFYGHASAYALFGDALAISQRGAWKVLPWCDVKAFHPLTLRAFPHLELRDGTKVPLNAHGSAFAEELYREIKRNVESPFTISRVERASSAPEPEPAEATAAKGKEDSPWGMLIVGVLSLLGAAWLFAQLEGLEQTGGEMRIHWAIAIAYNLGGKWGAAGLVGVVGIGLLLGGLNGLINGGKRPEPGRRDAR